jgi:hypothetical protein
MTPPRLHVSLLPSPLRPLGGRHSLLPSSLRSLGGRHSLLHSSLRPLGGRNKGGRNNGYTLIELVAALSLFVVILGVLMTILNSATDLWSASRNQKKEPTAAFAITDLIADDLYQAVTDISETNDLYHSFYVFSPAITNTLSDTVPTVTIHLAFLRPASPHTRIPAGLKSGTRTSLDMVFYTSYEFALFRHVIPVTIDFSQTVTYGVARAHSFISGASSSIVNNPDLHRDLLDPAAPPPETTSSLLVERVVPTFLAHYRDDPDPKPDNVQSDLLPHYLDFSLHLFDAEDWATYQSIRNDSSDAAELKRSLLGTLVSRRITLPQAGGSRLP